MSKYLLCASALALALPSSSHAATVLAVSEAELTMQAHAVVVANVLAVRTVVAKGGHVMTEADAQVMHSVKGPAPLTVITLHVPGGRLPNGMIVDVPGAPRLRAGQVVLGFLEAWGETYRPLGLAFGLLDVVSVDGKERVYRDLDNVHLVGPGGKAVAPERYGLRGEPLADVLARLRKHLNQAPVPSVRPGEGVRP